MISDEDYEKVSEHSWCVYINGAQCTIKNKRVTLHRFIANAEKGDIVDHINGNIYDNRRENLRIVDRSLNAFNWHKSRNPKSGMRGIYSTDWVWSDDKTITRYWTAEITINKKKHRKTFKDKAKAIEFRKRWEKVVKDSYQPSIAHLNKRD